MKAYSPNLAPPHPPIEELVYGGELSTEAAACTHLGFRVQGLGFIV